MEQSGGCVPGHAVPVFIVGQEQEHQKRVLHGIKQSHYFFAANGIPGK